MRCPPAAIAAGDLTGLIVEEIAATDELYAHSTSTPVAHTVVAIPARAPITASDHSRIVKTGRRVELHARAANPSELARVASGSWTDPSCTTRPARDHRIPRGADRRGVGEQEPNSAVSAVAAEAAR